MRGVFDELYRVVRSGGFVAFEVRGGKLRLENLVLPAVGRPVRSLSRRCERSVHEDGQLVGRDKQPEGNKQQQDCGRTKGRLTAGPLLSDFFMTKAIVDSRVEVAALGWRDHEPAVEEFWHVEVAVDSAVGELDFEGSALWIEPDGADGA